MGVRIDGCRACAPWVWACCLCLHTDPSPSTGTRRAAAMFLLPRTIRLGAVATARSPALPLRQPRTLSPDRVSSLAWCGYRWDGARSFGSDVYEKLDIPRDKIRVTFARSGGPGGQNVNKVETKVILRFHVASAHWIPEEVRDRLIEEETTRINKAGEFQMTSSRHRTQRRNLEDAYDKLQDVLDRACVPKKVREDRGATISTYGKKKRRKAKERRGERKQRRRVSQDDYDRW